MVSLYLSVNDAKAVAKKDNIHANGKFIDRNHFQVRVAVNSYLSMLLGDLLFTEGDLLSVKAAFMNYGLVKVVRGCQDLAESIMMGFADYSSCDHFGINYEQLLSYSNVEIRPIIIGLYNVHTRNRKRVSDSMHGWNTSGEAAALLQALLYLERFTYRDESSDTSCFNKFIEVNDKCRRISNNWSAWPGSSIMWMVRSAMEEIYTREDYKYDITLCHFSQGSTTDAKRDAGQMGKWRALARTETNYMRDPLMPLPGGENYHRGAISRYPRLTAVPKKLTSKRCIAPEDASCNYFAMGALEALRNMLTQNGQIEFINETDQSINRNFAEMGSRPDGQWATIDMSSASDSIPRATFMALIPEWYRPVIAEFTSDWFEVGLGERPEMRRMFTLFTSGNPLTWLTESTYFLAISRVACSLCGLKGNDVAYVYGDDIIIDSRAYETCCDLLEVFGHTVNRRKSYGTGDFRESCGGWYYHGYDVTPTFWPRHDIVMKGDDPNTVVRDLISLQHNLMSGGLDSAAESISGVVRELYRDITTSSYGSTYDDLWCREDTDYLDGLKPHTVIRQRTDVAKRNTLIDHVLYYQFLQFGPSYDSELDRLLGISSSRTETMYTLVRDDVEIYTVIPDNGFGVRVQLQRKPNAQNVQKKASGGDPKPKPKAKTATKAAPAKQAATPATPSKGGKVGQGANKHPKAKEDVKVYKPKTTPKRKG